MRVQLGHQAEPSMAAVDSQSVKKGPLVSQETGIDGAKNINGRKRHFAVDAIGLPLAIHVSAANVNDGVAGFDLLWQMDQESKRLSLVRADRAYQGEFQVAASYYKWQVEITQKPESQKGFVPQKGRWQVERSFAWLNFFRRLDKDHEKTVHSAIAFNQLAFVVIILANLSL
jgi:transposase